MDDILKTANELGIMIQDTEVYKNFQRMLLKLDKNEDAVRTLESYTSYAEELQVRRKNGDIIEAYEEERMDELKKAVRDSELLMQFIGARDAYMDLLLQIHTAIEQGEDGNE